MTIARYAPLVEAGWGDKITNSEKKQYNFEDWITGRWVAWVGALYAQFTDESVVRPEIATSKMLNQEAIHYIGTSVLRVAQLLDWDASRPKIADIEDHLGD
ncbi:hypothetical protein ACQR09_13380 [Bradyrhizobium oligotrophicum]|uniref:hypothetical protein n=1 Tax=Bradyrhizobium oligotrophicum TaxID=44255 RepID=UPI003EBA16ED